MSTRHGAVILAGAWWLASVALADSDKRVSLEVRQATLAQVADAISRQGEVRVLVDEEVRGERVSLKLSGVPVSLALSMVAEAAGLMVESLPEADSYRLRRPPKGAARPTQPGSTGWVPLDREKVRKVNLVCRNVAPSQIAGYFGAAAIKESPAGIVVEHPTPLLPSLVHGWVPAPTLADENAVRDDRYAYEPEVLQRFGDRWSVTEAGTPRRSRALGPFLSLPAGIHVMIGYDPAATLVLVGDPGVIDGFKDLVTQFDQPQRAVTLETRFLSMAASEVPQLGLTWSEPQPGAGPGLLATAVTEASRLMRPGLAGRVGNGPLLSSASGRPMVLSLTRVLAAGPGHQGCEGMSSDVSKSLQAVLATTDLKIVCWPRSGQAGAPLAVLLDPVFGDLLARFTAGNKTGTATMASVVPLARTIAEVRPGSTLVVRGAAPTGGLKSAESCSLLAELPLVGALYRQAAARPPVEVLVALTVK